MHGDGRFVQGSGAAVHLYRGELVLGVGAGLQDQRMAAHGAEVDQRDRYLVVAHRVDQGSHVLGDAGAAAVQVEVAHARVPGGADVP